MKLSFAIPLAIVLLWMVASPVCGQMATLQEVIAQKARWPKYAEEARRVQFQGRYASRAQDTFRLEKFDVVCRLPATIRLPDRLTDGQRLELTGKFMNDNGSITFLVGRLIVRNTDEDELSRRASEVPAQRPDDLLALASEYIADAEFYDDDSLRQQITAVRTRAVAAKRVQAKGKLAALEDVGRLGQSLNADSALLELIRFEILVERSKDPGEKLDVLLTEVQKFSGWNRKPATSPDRLKQNFLARCVENYAEGNQEDRQVLHHLLFQNLRLRQIRNELRTDGSNGLALADLLRKEFPEERSLISEFETMDVTGQLKRVDSLSRPQLKQLVDLLQRLGKQDRIADVVTQWLNVQIRRFGSDTLEGLLRTADEHFFAADVALGTPAREKGVELLKQAWALAEQESQADAREISERLKSLGWERLDGRWLTAKDVGLIPQDDIQLAIRDGRPVPGMTAAQVLNSRGQPSRISRLGSAKQMRELWIYDADGTAGIVIRLRRSLRSGAESLIVEDVSRMSRRP